MHECDICRAYGEQVPAEHKCQLCAFWLCDKHVFLRPTMGVVICGGQRHW
jgi:hypothetical protein